jgi:tRNA (guanine-N7-)-methyltransferase
VLIDPLDLKPVVADGGSARQASLIYKPGSWIDPLRLKEMFQRDQSLEVELGSGDGSFLAQWARLAPSRNFLGVERLLGRLRKLDRKGRRLGLDNLRLMRIEAAYFLNYLLPPSSTRALHVYFPDPWPKRKHRKNRLVNARFTELSARILTPDGVVFLRTDDADYFVQMQQVFGANPRFREIETPPALSAVATDFERGFNARGVATSRAAYVLCGV